MGDGLKITKDKRHRSSSSLAGAALEGTRSERKLEINASIPEVDDHFAVAEARCNELQENIDLIKSLKRKKKLKKRSMTKVMDPPISPDNIPYITVRTQPKKKVSSQAARLRRLEVPQNPTRGYLDPATVEQHRMIGQVRGYNNAFKVPQERVEVKPPVPVMRVDQGKQYPKMRVVRPQRTQAEGDSGTCQGPQLASESAMEVTYGQDDLSNYGSYAGSEVPQEMPPDCRQQAKTSSGRRKPKESPVKENGEGEANCLWKKLGAAPTSVSQWRAPSNRAQLSSSGSQADERPVVELFNKNHNITTPTHQRQNNIDLSPAPRKSRKANPANRMEDIISNQMEHFIAMGQHLPKKETYHPRRIKYRSRRYEMPTVASQMKQAGMRYYYNSTNHTNIPFVVSKSTAPSHNIGVNIQQVLNGLKIQQPLSGIPLTIAHHMGLGYVPTFSTKSAGLMPAIEPGQINAIKVGRRLLRLPSYKYMSYNRLLTMYREGDGMVPRFLKAISRPHYFYTSMYNLATNHEDIDAATSKGHSGSQEAKQNLAEFASLYREYENINKCIKEGQCGPEMELRKEELSREIAAREQYVRRVVQDHRVETEPTLRASASTAEGSYRHSTFKQGGDTQQ